jgi:hypothetical protein
VRATFWSIRLKWDFCIFCTVAGSVFLIRPSCICSLWGSDLLFQFEHGYSETGKEPHYSFVIWAPNEYKAQRTNLSLHSQCVRLSLRCSGAKRQQPEYSNSLNCYSHQATGALQDSSWQTKPRSWRKIAIALLPLLFATLLTNLEWKKAGGSVQKNAKKLTVH